MIDAIVLERIAYGKSIAPVSAIFVFKLILLERIDVSLANLRLNIKDVSEILTFKFSAAVALAISAAKSAPLVDMTFEISFATELPKALILLDNETVSLANLRLNINAVSEILVFKLILLESATVSLAILRLNINAVSEILVFKLIEAIVFDLIAYGNNMSAVSAIFTFNASSAIALAFSVLMDVIVFERIAYGKSIAAVSAILVFKLILLESATVSLAILRLNINAVSEILVFKLIEAIVFDLIAYGNNMSAVSAIFTFNASSAIALAFSVLMDVIVFERIAYGKSIAAVSAILVFKLILLESATVSLAILRLNINAVSEIFVFKLIEAMVFDLIAYGNNIAAVSEIFDFKLIEASVFERMAYGKSIEAVSKILTFNASAAIALALSAFNDAIVFERIAYGKSIAAVSEIFVFKLILFESATVSLANLLLNINDVSAIFTLNASAANALTFSASIEATVFDRMA